MKLVKKRQNLGAFVSVSYFLQHVAVSPPPMMVVVPVMPAAHVVPQACDKKQSPQLASPSSLTQGLPASGLCPLISAWNSCLTKSTLKACKGCHVWKPHDLEDDSGSMMKHGKYGKRVRAPRFVAATASSMRALVPASKPRFSAGFRANARLGATPGGIQ